MLSQECNSVFSSVILDSFVMASSTVCFTFFLELLSIFTVFEILQKPSGQRLYRTAVWYNILNNLIIGPPTYILASTLFCNIEQVSFVKSTITCGQLVLSHAIGYYFAHVLMHLKPFYWTHKFHHKFNTYIIPSAANAVSLAEYAIAYMLPFILGCYIFHPDGHSLFYAVSIVSTNNLLIHTPGLESISNILPPIFVSTANHFDHHRKLTTNYAAPTISIDYLLKFAKYYRNKYWYNINSMT